MTLMASVYGITSALTLACALRVLLADRPLTAGYFMTATMIGIGVLFWELKSPMLAGIQILIYGGGILVMVLFVIMLTPSGQSWLPRPGAWRITWLLIPVSGYVAARSYPLHRPVILGRSLGRWLLMGQGFSLEILAMFLLLTLASALAVATDPPNEEDAS
ncbi:MAG: NADH-ubiquinone oxidoreductase subunit 6 [Sulfobacillus thermosulfidooxidans]|uniref:NADH-quinone oxidoreductase subunit J n=1 Tax=Sulfobacillus thermosulfidooxidans TaxID=28034 RepID=A0A2T2WTM8_SULTH|nr:MAG: NADH-ubiquinone oxidoreductase subunit 6 [Sulfobacillus thermosulfidooxidans]